MLAMLIGGDGWLYNKWDWDATTNKYICFSVFLLHSVSITNHFTLHTKIHTLSRTSLSCDFCLSGFVTKIKFLFAEIVLQTQACTFFYELFKQDFFIEFIKFIFHAECINHNGQCHIIAWTDSKGRDWWYKWEHYPKWSKSRFNSIAPLKFQLVFIILYLVRRIQFFPSCWTSSRGISRLLSKDIE